MERLEKLRERAFDSSRFDGDIEFYTLFYQAYEQATALANEDRYAKAFYDAFSKLTPSITEGELIVGNRAAPLSDEMRNAWDEKYRQAALDGRAKAGNGQDSHMTIDYDLLLSKGIHGILAEIDRYLENCTQDKVGFYNCCKTCLQAVLAHSENYAQTALRMAQDAQTEAGKAELLKIAQLCRKVPAQPAETFHEAVQSVHFISHCLSLNPLRVCSQQFQLGHPDRYLLPFYENDIQNGTITKEYAQLLLDCLGIQINMRVPSGLSSGYMVGGRDEKGQLVANELTEMCMQVVDDIRLVYPAVGLCYTEGLDKQLETACQLLQKGYSHPAVFNDDVIVKGLMHYGVPEAQARSYIHSTCVEITPVAASNVWVASPYTNMPQLLLDIMDQEYASFDDLIEEYLRVLDTRIQANFEAENRERMVRANNSINPLLSCFVNDCLKRGLDIEQGGAIYNWIMPSFVGMANLIDALYVLKALVFEEKKLSICQFKTILDGNFENNEALRLHILNRIPKYGNDIDEIDRYFTQFTEHIAKECEKHHGTHSNANLIPSVFCWIMHERFGTETAATPDGRKAGFPLGDGSGACQGRELNGPTASVLSATKWDHHKFIGGVAVNLKFSKMSLGSASLATMKAILKTYLKRGGFEAQINVVDNETLKKAQKNPDAYRDLVVRIGGYSDYFVSLSPQMQEEVILRTTHHV